MSSESILSKHNSTILRGLAIIPIMLHNLLHTGFFNYPLENEMSYSPERWLSFVYAIKTGKGLLADCFSFAGWIGVSVFVFLTGYGLGVKYLKTENQSFSLKKNYLKLLILILPALLLFMGLDVVKHDWVSFVKRFSYIPFLTNFAYPYLNCSPGVYWYFGLTFQFYVFFFLARKLLKREPLVIISVLSIVGLFILGLLNVPKAFSIYRHCITGWFPVFAIGLLFSGIKKTDRMNTSWQVELLLSILLLLFAVFMNFHFITWVFIPIVSVFAFLFMGKLVLRIRFISEVFRWIGVYSSCLFVCHPIARVIINRVIPYIDNVFLIVLLFLVLSCLFAIVYSLMIGRIRNACLK